MIGNIGPLELILVLAIALVVLGPKRLPEAARALGRGLREFKDSVSTAAEGREEDEAPRPLEPPKPGETPR
jgi:sec-independent protein translocase protein TatA